jgi:xanthine dehydrogenase YagR molybdenum-binding subunit
MEPHATIAEWNGDQITLWDKSQWVGNVRDAIAAACSSSPATGSTA